MEVSMTFVLIGFIIGLFVGPLIAYVIDSIMHRKEMDKYPRLKRKRLRERKERRAKRWTRLKSILKF
jgi:membrane protein DedA with SNARE-associated domain